MPNLFIDVEARFAKLQDSMDQVNRVVKKGVGDMNRSFGTLEKGIRTISNVARGGVLLYAAQELAQLATAISRPAAEAERASIRLNAVLRNMGDSVKVTRAQIDEVADSLSRSTQFDDDSVRAAASALLTFGNIAEKEMLRALRASADVAAFFDKELPEAASELARALADPEAAAKLLKSAGRSLTDQEKELIKALGASGKIAEQQGIILGKLEEAYTGAARELGGGLIGELKKLGNQFGELTEDVASSGVTTLFTDLIRHAREYISEVREIRNITGSLFGDLWLEDIADVFRSNLESLEATRRKIDDIQKRIQAARNAGVPNNPQLAENLRRERLREQLFVYRRDREIDNDPYLQELATKGQDAEQAKREAGRASAFAPGPRAPSKSGGSGGNETESTFLALKRQLNAELTRELDLTERETLLADERFRKLLPAQRQELLAIAARVDAKREEARATETSNSLLDVVRAEEQEILRTELDAIERSKDALQASYDAKLETATNYYAQRAALEDRALALQIDAASAELDQARNIESDTSKPLAERIEAMRDVARLSEEIKRLETERGAVEVTNARAAASAVDDQRRALESLRFQMREDAGEVTYEDRFQRGLQENEGLLNSDLTQEEKLDVVRYINVQAAREELAEFERDFSITMERIRSQEEAVIRDRDSGAISGLTAEQRIAEIRAQGTAELHKQVAAVKELAAAHPSAFGPEQDQRIRNMVDSTKELQKQTDELAGLYRQMGETIAGAFEEAIIGGNSFKETINSLGKDIQRLLLREFVTKPLASSLSSSIGNLAVQFGSSFFGGGGGGAVNLDANTLDGLAALYGGGRAVGGPVQGGRMYRVNETGPEFFVPHESGKVVPLGQMPPGAFGGAKATVNVYARDASSFHASRTQTAVAMQLALNRASRAL